MTRVRNFVAYLALSCLLGGCESMLVGSIGTLRESGGFVQVRVVNYPMRGPEYVVRDLGGNRYLLGQWTTDLGSDPFVRMQ
jgi:hypothetical protein